MKTMINSIVPSTIIIDDRQRKEFPTDEHEKLKASILKNGLFHAIGLLSSKEPRLIYGHRRLLAITSILSEGKSFTYNGRVYDSTIPFVAVGDMTALQLQEIELSENIDRLDLSWQEKAKTIAALEALRNTQREEVAAITDSPTVPVTLKELAEETKQSVAPISDALAIAKHLDDPDVAKAKSLREAKKVVERKAKQAIAEQRAETFVKSTKHQLLIGDCREHIKHLPDGEFDLILTDPPYGIDMNTMKSWDGTWHDYDDSEAYTLNLITSLLPEWDRVTRDEAHLYIFCDFSKFFLLKSIVEEHGTFEVMPYPFIWNKGNVASYANAFHHPRKSYECILYAIKGKKEHNKLDLAVIDIPQKSHHDHPAGKPSALYSHLIKRSCLVGDKVLDCFAGQGTIFKAAEETKTIATGIELNDDYAILAKNTLLEIEEDA